MAKPNVVTRAGHFVGDVFEAAGGGLTRLRKGIFRK